MEPRYEDSALFRDIAHSHTCTRSRRKTGKAAGRRREAARSSEAVGARWLQACRNAGECTAAPALRTGTPAEESSPTSVPDAADGATPKDQQ